MLEGSRLYIHLHYAQGSVLRQKKNKRTYREMTAWMTAMRVSCPVTSVESGEGHNRVFQGCIACAPYTSDVGHVPSFSLENEVVKPNFFAAGKFV